MGMFDKANLNSHKSDVTSEEHSQLAKELSAAAHVLLQNKDDLLPLSAEQGPLRIAMIGQAARRPIVSGGGSGRVIPKYVVSPYDGVMQHLGIKDAFPMQVDCPSSGVMSNMTIAQGCWPSEPTSSLEDCAQQCADDLSCSFYSYRNHDNEYAWCTLYPTDYLLQTTQDGTVVGSCSKVEPEPVWQCNEKQICVATIDGSDHKGTAACKLQYISCNTKLILIQLLPSWPPKRMCPLCS